MSLVFFELSILGRFFLCAGTPNRDDRLSPAWVSACPASLLCAGCGLGEHQMSNLSYGHSFPFIPLQTYLNSSLYSSSGDSWLAGHFSGTWGSLRSLLKYDTFSLWKTQFRAPRPRCPFSWFRASDLMRSGFNRNSRLQSELLVCLTLIPLRTYWNCLKKSLAFFELSIFSRCFLCAGTPNRDDRVSPAWVSACFGQLLCAGCGLREHQMFIVSFGLSFLCIPLQTYLNPGSYCRSGSSDPWFPGLHYYRGPINVEKDLSQLQILFPGILLMLIWLGLTWLDLIWFDLNRFDLIWFELIRPDLIWRDLIWFDLIWLDLTWLDLTWPVLTWSDSTWPDLTWFDVIWFDLIWFGLNGLDLIWVDLIWFD